MTNQQKPKVSREELKDAVGEETIGFRIIIECLEDLLESKDIEIVKSREMAKLKVSREELYKVAEGIEDIVSNLIPNAEAIEYSAVLVEHIGGWLKSKGIEVEE